MAGPTGASVVAVGNTGAAHLAARRIGIVVAALHAAHRGDGQPGLRPRSWIGSREQGLKRLRRRIEFMQVLLHGRAREQHVGGHGARIRPARDGRERATREARIAQLARALQIVPRDRDGERRIVGTRGERLARTTLLEAIGGRGRQHLDHLVVARGHDRRSVRGRQRPAEQRKDQQRGGGRRAAHAARNGPEWEFGMHRRRRGGTSPPRLVVNRPAAARSCRTWAA